MKTPVTRLRLRNHLTYSWWKYLLLAVIAVFGWNIIYTVTRYRAPEEKKIVVNVYTYGDQTPLDAYLADVNANLLPEMEEMYCTYTSPDDTYGDMVYSAHLAAAEGDVHILTRDYFQRYASTGAYIALEDDADLLAMLEAAGVSVSQGWRVDTDTGERHLFGIPCASLPGLSAFLYNPTDCYISVLYRNGNDDNVIPFLHTFIADMLREPGAGAE